MIDIISPIISCEATVLDALEKIDSISIKNSGILFVSDTDNRIIGSISDGDCRRALIKNRRLDISVKEIMKTDFTYMKKSVFDISIIQKIHALGLKYVPELNEDGTLYKIHDFSNGKSCIPVDAVLMAGGKGERLRPLTLETPKPLLKVADKPIIDYNIDNIIHYGIEHINVTVNYLGDQIEEHFKELDTEY